MEKYIKQIGKVVLSADDAQMVGYVLDIFVDEGWKVEGYVVVDSESENEAFLSLKDVKASNECIVIEESSSLKPLFQENKNPLHKNVVSTDGVGLGRVSSLKLTGKKIEKIITEKCEIKPSHILSQSKNILIFKKNKKNIKKNEKNNQKVINYPKIEIMTNNEIKSGQSLPPRLSISPKMILNKHAAIDIFGLNNELIVKKDEIITQKTIEKAKKHNKLNFLIFNCK